MEVVPKADEVSVLAFGCSLAAPVPALKALNAPNPAAGFTSPENAEVGGETGVDEGAPNDPKIPPAELGFASELLSPSERLPNAEGVGFVGVTSDIDNSRVISGTSRVVVEGGAGAAAGGPPNPNPGPPNALAPPLFPRFANAPNAPVVPLPPPNAFVVEPPPNAPLLEPLPNAPVFEPLPNALPEPPKAEVVAGGLGSDVEPNTGADG